MPDSNPLAALIRRMNPGYSDVPDAELLDRFVQSADQAAFELLVWRHGAMVWGVCRRILGPDRHAAEDACQAVFVALARHAARLGGRRAVAAWLHRVAVRAAIDLGRSSARLRPAEHADLHARDPDPARAASDREVRALLDTGLNALPDKLRAPFVLCELEGRTNAEAADALGCPVGTVESRLTRARQRLRDWLTARGVVPAVATAAVALPESARSAMVRAADSAQPSAAVKALAARAIPPTVSAKARALVAAGLVLVGGTVGLGMALAEEPKSGGQREVIMLPPEPLEGRIVAGKVVDALIMEASMARDGEVKFVVPLPASAPDKLPERAISSARVDGKEVRAVGVDGRPIDAAELADRLQKWTPVVVFSSDLDVPHPTYRKVLAERTVIFLVPKTLHATMVKAAEDRRRLNGVIFPP